MPQPVVSSRYLFLCSPPKMVLAFRPDSRPTFRKLMPRSAPGSAAFCCSTLARARRGHASARTCSSDNTNAERLRDLRNTRREGNNEVATWPAWLVLEFALLPYMQ